MKSYLQFFLVLTLTFISQNSFAQIYNGLNADETNLQSIVDRVQPGTIVVIGELHGMPEIQAKQMELLNAIRAKGLPLSIGFEFLNFTDQKLVDDYRSKIVTEDEFKTAVNWGSGFDFNYYKDQILFPNSTLGETTLGLNVPGYITKQIAKGGYDSLTVDQKLLLPLDFTLGNAGYKERFSVAAGPHMPADKLDSYFAAQSAWDEAMASSTINYFETHQDQVFVIIVGEFHVQFGGGVPDRLRQRLAQKGLPADILTVSQGWSEGLTPDEFQAEIQPSPVYGRRADFVWMIGPQS